MEEKMAKKNCDNCGEPLQATIIIYGDAHPGTFDVNCDTCGRPLRLCNGHLIERFPENGIKSENLEDVDRVKYEQLQALVRKEILEDFHSEIYPVQYDDILFRKLNRPVATPA